MKHFAFVLLFTGIFMIAEAQSGMTILNNGHVGIGNTNPLYDLSVTGNGYFSTYLGVHTPPNSSYSLSVAGPARYFNDIRVDGVLNPTSALNIGTNVAVGGLLTVSNGKGIVRSTSSSQMKIKRITISLSATSFGAGSTFDSGYLYFGEDFSSVSVTVGQAFNGTGDWAKVLLVPFEVDETNDRCRFKVTNVAGSSITFDSDWEIVLIGN
jgi:hypothetical protein